MDERRKGGERRRHGAEGLADIYGLGGQGRGSPGGNCRGVDSVGFEGSEGPNDWGCGEVPVWWMNCLTRVGNTWVFQGLVPLVTKQKAGDGSLYTCAVKIAARSTAH